MMPFLAAITDIGDSAVIVPVALAGALYLFACGCRRQGAALLLSLVMCALVVSLLKVLLISCRVEMHVPALRSPSGHAALSAAVFGTYAMIIAEAAGRRVRFIALAAFVLLASTIGISRVVLGYHTALEVVAGLAIGEVICVLAWIFLTRHERKATFSPRVFALVGLVTATLLYGARLPSEDLIHLIVIHFRTSAHLCHGNP